MTRQSRRLIEIASPAARNDGLVIAGRYGLLEGAEVVQSGEINGGWLTETDKYPAKRFDVESESTIDTGVLEAIPFAYPGSATEVAYETDEFTAVCPWTGLPDFARLTISYVPNRVLVELKSLKYYLASYRNVGILQEHAVNRILKDLIRLMEPLAMEVAAEYRERGGIKSRAVAKYTRDETRSDT